MSESRLCMNSLCHLCTNGSCTHSCHPWAPQQGDLFADPAPQPTGPQLRDEAIARVDANAHQRWKVAAMEAVQAVAAMRDTFTTDDVWAVLGGFDVSTHELRAMGAVMQTAKKRGLIRATSDFRMSTRPECHARPVRVWVGAG